MTNIHGLLPRPSLKSYLASLGSPRNPTKPDLILVPNYFTVELPLLETTSEQSEPIEWELASNYSFIKVTAAICQHHAVLINPMTPAENSLRSTVMLHTHLLLGRTS